MILIKLKKIDMKIYFLIPVLLFFGSCKCKKDVTTDNVSADFIPNEKFQKMLTTFCPENGKCTTEIFRNKSLDIKSDEFGSIYYNQIDNLETSIIKFSYSRNVPKGLQDGSYREEIVFEINNSDKQIAFKNEDIQKTKMLFGRFCYCKGSTGNYKINDGNLILIQKNNKIQFELEFKNNKVPQLLKTISEVVE